MRGPALGFEMALSHTIETLSQYATFCRVVVVLSTPSASFFASSRAFVCSVMNRLESFHDYMTGEVVTSYYLSQYSGFESSIGIGVGQSSSAVPGIQSGLIEYFLGFG
jgi:hypothetical protein